MVSNIVNICLVKVVLQRDEPDHEKAVNVPTAPARESSKIILKVPRLTVEL